jgi:hypothetical protein
MTRSYSSLLTWLGLTIAASVMLYHTSDRVNALDQQLRTLNTQIEAERESIHVLNAEWVYLANPARIEAEAQRHLNLQPTAPRHVAALHDIGDLLPLHNGIEPAPQTQLADAAIPSPVHAQAPAPMAAQVTHSKHDKIVAALNAGHINDHMIMQHSAVVEASTDSIGSLIGKLGLRP